MNTPTDPLVARLLAAVDKEQHHTRKWNDMVATLMAGGRSRAGR